MQKRPQSKVQDVLTAKQHHKVWLRIASGLMAVVVFCTTYALILPAITLASDTYCGLEEHTHTDKCYTQVTAPKLAYTCDPTAEADVVLHTHDEYCYNEAGVLICTLDERTAHTHGDDCYDQEDNLTCDLAEVQEHIHSDECLNELYGFLECGLPQVITHQHTEDCLSAVTEKTQICQPDKDVAHTHDAMCYDSEGNLVCTLTEREGHTHTDACYQEERELTCGIEGHEHTDACYTAESRLTCGQSEHEAHTHTDACYAETSELTCGQSEHEGHTHSDSCYDENGELICGQEESEGHYHSDACYTVTRSLVCGQEESQGHTHSDACYSMVDELTCGYEGHVHSDDCYTVTDTLACGQEETPTHQHTEACFTEEPVMEEFSVLICDQEEHTHEEQCFEEPESLTFTYEDDLVSGVITLPWRKELPDDLTCTVIALDGEEDGYDDMIESVDDTLQMNSMTQSDIQLYQLEWTSDGEVYTLPEGLVPTVTLTLLNPLPEDSDASLMGVVITANDPEAEEALEDEAGEEAAIAEDEEISLMALSLDGDADGDTVADDETEEMDDRPINLYDVELLALDGDNNATVTAEVGDGDSVGVAAFVATTTVTGGYYRRVEDLEDLTNLINMDYDSKGNYYSESYYNSNSGSWSKFVFVFANGMYALSGVTNISGGQYNRDTEVTYPEFSLHKVEIQEVAGNPDYVTIKDVSTGTVYSPTTMKDEHYTIQGNNPGDRSTYIIREYGASANAWMGLVGGPSARSADTETKNKKETFNFEYNSDQQVFYLYNSTYGYVSVTIDPPGSEYYKYWQVDSENYYSDGHNGTLDTPFFQTTNETASVVIEDYTFDTDHSYYQVNLADMVIYVYESDAELDVPVVPSSSGTSDSLLPREDRTTYDTYKKSTDAVNGDTDQYGTYYSDTGTSNIETLLGRADKDAALDSDLSEAELKEKYAEITAEQSENDGRIVTDKTVTFGEDPYKVYTYQDGEFSVTLSALGQEWVVSEETDSPIDVMFLLDFSGSMTASASSTDDTTRWMAAVEAMNAAMEEILNRNSNNRVGVVMFSNTAVTVMPLGRYEVNEDEVAEGYLPGFLSYDTTQTTEYGMRTTLGTNRAMYYEENGVMKQYPFVSCAYGYNSQMWSGTYTQLGLQKTYQEFANATPTVTTEDKEVIRQPVFIFLTDGEPTFGTYNYMDPASGPRYGYGNYGEAGMFGYYTILSANYFKDMVSAHYGKTAAFYSIGIGMKASGTGSYLLETTKTTNYYADDTYRRAVINPTASNVEDLNDDVSAVYDAYNTNYGYTFYKNMTIADWTASKLLYKLLTSGNPTSYVQNTLVRYYQYDSNGYMSAYNTDEYWLRAIKNPYADDYSYADDAIFYGNFTEDELEKYFDEIIGTVQKINYGILLKKGTDLVITDPLGAGMKVVGDPTLIYNGTKLAADPRYTSYGNNSDEYGSYTEYSWSVTTPTRAGADKKGTQSGTVKARIYTSADKTTQVVQFIIPENLLPALYPDRYQEFYYEELPVRLVYKVGIDVDSDAYQDAANGSALYTNLYDDTNGKDGDATAYTTFYPDSTNPYYVLYDYDDENFGEEPWMDNYIISKDTYDDDDNVISTTNVTETATNVFEEDVNYVEDEEKNPEDWDEIEVIQHLGNNGKVILSKAETDSVTVSKQWASGTDPEPVSVTLYRAGTRAKTSDGSNSKTGVWAYETVKLNTGNSWTYTWKNLPKTENRADGYTYTYTDYYISEVTGGSFVASYADGKGNALTPETISVDYSAFSLPDEDKTAVKVDGSKVIITNKPAYTLPHSGGVGTQVYTWSGMAILTTAIALYALIRRKQRNRGQGGEV